jgi:hypothetical protein
LSDAMTTSCSALGSYGLNPFIQMFIASFAAAIFPLRQGGPLRRGLRTSWAVTSLANHAWRPLAAIWWLRRGRTSLTIMSSCFCMTSVFKSLRVSSSRRIFRIRREHRNSDARDRHQPSAFVWLPPV